MKTFEDLDVQLSIDANFLKALESLEVIAIEGDRHHAVRSRLGWCVVGPLPEGKDEYRFQFNGI